MQSRQNEPRQQLDDQTSASVAGERLCFRGRVGGREKEGDHEETRHPQEDRRLVEEHVLVPNR